MTTLTLLTRGRRSVETFDTFADAARRAHHVSRTHAARVVAIHEEPVR